VWDAASDVSVLDVEVLGRASADSLAFDLATLPLAVTVVPGGAAERVILCDGYRRIALTVTRGSLLEGPVRTRFLLDHAGEIDRRLMTLRRLIALLDTGRFVRSLFPPEPRARRWLMALRASDAMVAGASQREIAEELFAPLSRGMRWNSDADFLRLRVSRLLSLARRAAAGEYRMLLR
jgi:hypothetical protein